MIKVKHKAPWTKAGSFVEAAKYKKQRRTLEEQREALTVSLAKIERRIGRHNINGGRENMSVLIDLRNRTQARIISINMAIQLRNKRAA